MRRPRDASMRSRREAIRSLMPSRSSESADSCSSVAAASRNSLTSIVFSSSCSIASEVERTPARIFMAAPTRRLASTISMVLASHTVQVTTEANDKADQDRLHHWIGAEIHAPRREIAWQGRRADHRASPAPCARADHGVNVIAIAPSSAMTTQAHPTTRAEHIGYDRPETAYRI